jgi:hypothetical protein
MERRHSYADKTKLLHAAVKDEDLSAVTVLCNAGTDVNAEDAVRANRARARLDSR